MNYYDIVSVTGSDVKSAITLSEFLADSDKSRFEINELAKRVGALQRQGKSFDFAKFLHAGIAFQGKVVLIRLLTIWIIAEMNT